MSSTKRGGTSGRLLGIGAIIVPILLGFLGMRGRQQEKEALERSIKQGHEIRDLPLRGILLFFIGLIIMGAIALAITTTVEILSSKQGGITFQYPPAGLANAPQPTLPPEPRLEDVPGQNYQDLLSKQDAQLNSYGWIDQKTGVVHIPIDRAIDLLLQKGLPSRPSTGTQYQDTGDQAPSYPSSGRMPEKFP